jgi:SpoVK/Ycf46/Vps4 family AAA+-type ATPase
MENLRAWLKSRKKAFGSSKARDFGLAEPKGAMLCGVPGAGKSLVAKTIAKQWGLPLLRLDPGKLFGSLVGQSESQTRLAIEAAEACAPCVLWIDEIEKGFGNSGSMDGGTTSRVFGTLLTWMNDKTAPVFVIATANRPHILPPELIRKGRFDEIWFIGLPDVYERREIISIHLARRKRTLTESEIGGIAEATDGFSGAEIEQAIIEALFTAFDEGEREVTMQDVIDAAQATQPLSKTAAPDIEAISAWAKGKARAASGAEKKKPAGRYRGTKAEKNN